MTDKILLSSNDKTYSFQKGEVIENIIPVMTSETSSIGEAIASSYYASNYPYKAYDGVTTGNGWLGNGNSNEWLGYKFNEPQKISKYSILIASGGVGSTTYPKVWTFEGSNDGTNWTVLDAQSGYIVSNWTVNTWYNFDITNTENFIYYRIYITETNGSTTYTKISEFNMTSALDNEIMELPSHSEQNLIKYGMDSPVQVDGIFTSKNYILSPTESKNENGLLTTQINRKPLSIGIS